MSSFIYFFKESIRGLTRHVSTTLGSIITTFLSLLLIGVFLVAGVMIADIIESLESEVSITAYLSDEATDSDVDSAMSAISSYEGVQNVTYKSKDDALEEFTKNNGQDIISALDGENPLPASLQIELSEPQLVETVAEQIEGSSQFKKVAEHADSPASDLRYGQETANKLFTVTNYARYVGVALIALLIFIALVFINNTIRLAILSRRKEIGIMRLVGASNGFIRGPFLMEGALHALIGSILAVLVIEALRIWALPLLQTAISFLPLNVDAASFAFIYIALIIAGLIIGLIGSALAMRRYLKV